MLSDKSAIDDSEHAPSQLGGFSYTNLLELLWRRKLLLALGLAIGLMLGSLHYARQTPIYQSSAQVLVVKKRPDALPTGIVPGTFPAEDYLSTHVMLMRSPLVIERAVEKWELRALRSFTGMGDPTGAIIGGLSISRDAGSVGSSSILNLSYRGTEPDECPLILNAVIDAYQEFLTDTYETANEDTLKLITEKTEQVQRELREKGLAYQEFRKSAPVLWKGEDGSSFHQDRLSAIESRRSALLIRRTELEPRLAALKKAVADGEDQEKLLAMVTNWSEERTEENATGSRSEEDNLAELLEAKLFPLLLEEKNLLQDFGKDHPEVQRVRNQIQMTREFHSRFADERSRAAAMLSQPKTETRDPVQAYIASLEQELADIETTENALAKLFEQEHEFARSLSNFELEDNRYMAEISRAERLYDSLLTQLQGLNLGKDFGGYTTRIISAAGDGWRIEPRGTPIFLMSSLMGLMGGFGIAYLLEIADKRFRTPDEIRRRLGVAVVGHIPFIKPSPDAVAKIAAGEITLDPTLVSHYRPKSYEAEAFRGVRTALYFSTHGEEHKVIQITSANAGDGKTTVAANLAVSIAQSGKRTLLIDADLRKPRVHRVFGISSEGGLAAAIAGELELCEAVLETSIPGLHLLPCGKLPSNPAELLTSPRFEELLALIREQYDFVLVDTPPILAVTDPCVVAARVDGVILTISVNKDGRHQAERAREILGTLGANVLGVVVNGTEPEDAYGYGYGYGNYSYGGRYGYGSYGYGGKYAYAYEEGVRDGYLQGEDTTATATAEELESAVQSNGSGAQHHQTGDHNGSHKGIFRRLADWW